MAITASTVMPAQDEKAPDSLGLPGDHFDLFGALELFKSATSLEEFEKKLNEESGEVNNLDLNEDGKVDYVRVIDNMDGEAHAIILQVPVNESESQDVAAIEIEKTGAETANLQIVGDEELYGADYVVEPTDAKASSGSQNWSDVKNFSRLHVVMNVWFWPPVRFIYAPGYRVWVSPWRWAVYPVWWTPWRPVAWHVHHKRVIRYHHHFYYGHHRRMVRAHAVYVHHRKTSPVVHQRNAPRHQARAAHPGSRQPAVKKGGGQKGKAQPGRTKAKAGAKPGPKGGGGKGGGKGGRK
ncbi:MAG TPA: hypothetical protein VI731_00955 [Bacteroidia bacterium]|nr:hypothetical protein [Bacteroidia bacterium]